MASSVGRDTSTDTEETFDITVLRQNLVELFNSNQINWSGINWRQTGQQVVFGDDDESSTDDLFLTVVGTNEMDHVRNPTFFFPDGETNRSITGAMFGMAGDDVLYSLHPEYIPFLAGGTGNDTYFFEGGSSAEFLEYGNDSDDTLIFNVNDIGFVGDIEGRHLIMANSSQSDVLVIWNYTVPEARIENFWIDWNKDGVNEEYKYDEFISLIKTDSTWFGSLSSESLAISAPTWYELTESVAGALNSSLAHEPFREADLSVVEDIARLYTAAFDRAPDVGGLNFWIGQWELSLISINQMADEFLLSQEFLNTYGDLDNNAYITELYDNVLDRTPDAEGFDYWTGRLTGGLERADVLVSFAQSPENRNNSEELLSGLQETSPGVWDLILI
ncbi:DUF4214 domain-containing protein [Motiliproteus sp. MSK22-1]|uniref:DUF4214 domain-containing protein n=1 Tax=Motiliproteus sp. MSK22-1 TaxID=1897630 RepID=UPI000976EC06|nr:DUF4214 domain-containing protein [Motiliproteus sp. MSK22-1]OMH36253.1 hypothetical protein BGP75_09900 [Motiliproteus sp. MSK22-1]